MDDLVGSFPKSVWVGTKHAKKSHVGLWGQSLILKTIEVDFRDLKKNYLRRVLTGRGFWSTRVLSELSPCEVS